jgi:ribosome-binding factor A
MSNQRAARVGDQMREELASLIRTNVKDPRVGFVSIVKVEVSGDLRHAKVYVSVMGSEPERKESIRALQSAGGFLRGQLSQIMSLRYTPELHFHLDDSIAHGTRIAALLVQVQKDQAVQDAQVKEQQHLDQEEKGE